MDMHLFWIFLYTSFDKLFPVITKGFVNDHVIFKVHRKHQALRKCAMEIMQNHTYVGGLVGDSKTDPCKKLTTYLDHENRTTEQGHGYFEKVQIERYYQSEPDQSTYEHEVSFPGPLTAGSKLEFTFFRTDYRAHYMYWFFIESGPRVREDPNSVTDTLQVQIHEESNELIVGIYSNDYGNHFPFDDQVMCPSPECKFSLVIHEEQIEIFANDKPVPNGTLNALTTTIGQMRHARVPVFDGIKLTHFEFIK